MHYVPESAREFFQEPSRSTAAEDAALAESAALYALTLLVGLLLATDALLGAGWWPDFAWLRTPGGYRLALLAAVLGGSRILYHSLDNLLAGRIRADLALTTACLAAIVLGEHQTAALVVLISLLGEAVESFTLQQAKTAIRRSFAQRPQTAQLLRDGLDREIPVTELQPGDHILVRYGDRIPVDGKIEAGSSPINESPFTGESAAVEKSPGDLVLAGSTNLGGPLTVLVERFAADTAIARLADVVQHATARKMNCERTADRFAQWFLPAVLTAAGLTLLGWRWQTGTWQAGWNPALGVLVVACPCALILATPCAVMASLAWLARRGIVIKGSAALERLATVDAIAFDKTGTLSDGDLTLGEIVPLTDLSADQLLQLAATAERPISHPLANLLRQSAQQRALPVAWPAEFTSQVGAGVIAQVDGREIRIGSIRLMSNLLTVAAEEVISRLQQAGQSPVLIAIDHQLVGLIGVREALRPEAMEVLRDLRSLGHSPLVLLSGDRQASAEAVARSLSAFDEVFAEQSPEQKGDRIVSLQQAGRRVAMIGDGINDGPALAKADVGIAVCRGDQALAAEAGDILLLGDPLRPLPGLIRLSRVLVENIRQSLYWFALGLNGLGMLACAAGWLSPVMAAVVHEVSSLFVMLNALRLLWWREPRLEPVASAESRVNWDRWLAQLTPGTVLARMIRHWRITLQVAGGVLLAVWLCSQIVFVTADEAIVVLRGGRYLTTLESGWSWRWPWPMERLVRLRPAAIESVSIGFRDDAPKQAAATDLEWTSPHHETRSVPEESQYLTGDGVAVELTAEVQYRIRDVRKFALAGAIEPRDAVRAAAESVLRSAIAVETLDHVLTERRAEMESACRDQLRSRVNDYDLGLEILALNWLDVHPPRPVVDAYRQVSNAWEQREQAINEAQSLATRTLFHTAGEQAIRQLNRTQQFDEPLTAEEWQQLIAVRPDGSRMLTGTAGATLQEAEAAAEQQRQSALGQADRLRFLLAAWQTSPELSRIHFYWQAVTDALGGKPFTLIDPALSGRRTLYLGDWPRPAVPPVSPVEP